MPNQHIFPRKDGDFDSYITNAIPYLTKNAARLGISADNVTAITSLLEAWSKNWGAFIDPTQRTTVITQNKTNLRRQAEQTLRAIYEDIPRSALITDDFTELGMKPRRGTHTRVSKLKEAPTMSVQKREHLLHILRFKDNDHPTKKALPKGQKIVLRYVTGAPNLADTALVFTNTKNVTRFLTPVMFDASQEGQTCYYQSCYESTHGERGPWSMTLKAVVA